MRVFKSSTAKSFLWILGAALALTPTLPRWNGSAGLSIARAADGAPVTVAGITLSSDDVSWSAVTISGEVEPDQLWAWIQLDHDGSPRQEEFAPVHDGRFTKIVYLRAGSGDYDIHVLLSKVDQYHAYYARAAFHLVNRDDRPNPEYLLPSDYVDSDDLRIVLLAARLTAGKQSDMQKLRAIYSWVTENVVYDPNYPPGSKTPNYMQKATETLSRKVALCNGYANLVAALCRAAGLPARMINGVAGKNPDEIKKNLPPGGFNHGWNEVRVDGRWVTVDATWDAGFFNTQDGKYVHSPGTRYFDPNPSEFAKDHQSVLVLPW